MIYHLAIFILALSSVAFGTPQRSLAPRELSPCASFTSLYFENTTILQASYFAADSNISTAGFCVSSVSNTVNICRIYGMIDTSPSSDVKFEVWMPDTWHGRFLSAGNSAFGGCMDYDMLDYGTNLHFATVSADGGHSGVDGFSLYHRPEVIKDLSYRSVHIATVIGKQIVEAYYSRVISRSYYSGCSTGGRQGIQSALLYPEDFDGIIAGAPSVDWNHFVASGGILTNLVKTGSDEFIPIMLWTTITQEILKQCDALDGLMDGIVSEPDVCDFNPGTLLCARGQTANCLTQAQVDALRMVYEPIYGGKGELIWPRFDPGSELQTAYGIPMSGEMPVLTSEWMRYAIYNDTNRSMDNFSVSDIEFADSINPGGIATWSGNLSAFRNRGGKLLSYHGRSDNVVPSGNSKRFYKLVSSTLSLSTLDDFMRLFLVPGMFHCGPGGAWAFGQGTSASGLSTATINDTNNNILLALVDWVEGGNAPDNITGLDDRLAARVHCRYPFKSVWDGSRWSCV